MSKVVAILLSLLVLLAGCGGPPYEFHGTAYDPVKAAPELVGVQAGNAPFNLRDVPEKVKLLFFGYTFCPDVCPLTLANMRAVYDLLPAVEQKNVAVILVSVDPERDTPDRLGEYVAAFHPAFYGVHVPADALAQAKQEYGVYAEKSQVDSSQSAAEYLIDHTAAVYVIDKHDNLRAVFSNDAPPADIAADVEHLLEQ
jgi:protein SCO1/2